jgi:hypothetical protein
MRHHTPGFVDLQGLARVLQESQGHFLGRNAAEPGIGHKTHRTGIGFTLVAFRGVTI